MRFGRLSLALVAVWILSAELAVAGTKYGELVVNANPEQAYVFVDGEAMHEASYGPIKLAIGDHTVSLYNYGFKPEIRKVTIRHWRTTTLDATLEPIPGSAHGPWGCITIKGAPRAAVLLDGKTPEYFVGHGDEFNNEHGPKQELLVPPGSHTLTLMQGYKAVWSGTVTVDADKRVIVDAHRGVERTVDWPRGAQLQDMPRFTVGIASAEVAVNKPTVQLTANAPDLGCGGSEQLAWKTTDAAHVEISGLGSVPLEGEQTVQPRETTDYTITASGPGGTATSDVHVKVGAPIDASLTASPAEVHYKRIGDKVVQQEGATLNWSVSNANSVSIDPLGPVDPAGTRPLQLSPQKTTPGPVDETVTYKLTASNNCGTTQTRTASVHIVGSIEPEVSVARTQLEKRLALHSIYFATAQPPVANPYGGLMPSQQRTLRVMATDFKEYLQYKPGAVLYLEGHADQRGSAEYNQALSERRVESAKHFLVANGIPDASIKIAAEGFQKNLTAEDVKRQIDQDPQLTPPDRAKIERNMRTIVLANNRRVDATLSTTGEQSVREFPFNAEDALNLIGGPVRPPAKPVARKRTTPAHGRTSARTPARKPPVRKRPTPRGKK